MSDERTGVDNAFLKAAVGLSRRGFLKKLGGFGLGAGLSMVAGVGVARAMGDDCYVESSCVNVGRCLGGQIKFREHWICPNSGEIFDRYTCGIC